MPKKQNKISLVWFKNDLRVNDNQSLSKAIAESENVVATYIFDPRQFQETKYGFKKTEKFRAQFLIETVQGLMQNLEALNIPLFVYFDYTETCIAELEEQFKFDAMYCQKEWTDEETKILEVVKDTWDS